MTTYVRTIGESVGIKATFTTEAGSAYDPASVVALVTFEDATTETLIATKSSVGVYTTTYTPSTAGKYYVLTIEGDDDFDQIAAAKFFMESVR